jgi:hypothetical protein
MSITTYAELQTAVGDWLHRNGLSNIPDLITMGESRINRELRLFDMENVASLTASTSNRFVTLPTGFIEAIDLTLYSDNYPQTLSQVPLSRINSRATDISGLPHYYAISSNIIFDVKPDDTYALSLRYLKRLDIATDLTNTVLVKYPDIYIYSALMAAAPYLKNDDRIAMWRDLLADAVKSANRLDARTRGKSRLMVDPGLRQAPQGDIMSGDNW